MALDHSSEFSGQILGFTGDSIAASSDQIDLKDILYAAGTTTASYVGTTSGGTLTVSDAEHDTGSISLVGNYETSTFTVSSDGHDGTLVIDPMATQALVDGTFLFNESGSGEAYSISVAAQNAGAGYVGSFTVDATNASNGQESVGWQFNFDPGSLTQAITQTYEVTLAGPQASSASNAATQSVSVTVGGAGADTFVFKPGFGADVVANATSADIIELDGFSSVTSVSELQTLLSEAQAGQPQSLFQAANGGHDTVINLGNHDSITLANLQIAGLHASNFVVHPPIIG